MNRSNLGAVRPSFLTAAVLAFLSVPLSAQVVEKGRTFADLTASHPCASGYTDRIARVTDCDAADDIGDGGGAFQCWAICDGSAPWAAVSIGGGGGGAATAVTGSATLPATCAELDLYQDTDSGGTEFYVCTAANTWTKAGTIGGTLTATDDLSVCTDGTGGSTIAACVNMTLGGNVTGPTAGFTIFGGTSTTADLIFQTTTGVGASGSNMDFLVGNNGALVGMRLQYDGQAVFKTVNIGSSDGTDTTAAQAFDGSNIYLGHQIAIGWGAASTPTSYGFARDTTFSREAADVVKFDSLIELTPIASGGTCDAGNEGRIYNDSSHALCWCDGTTAQKLSGGGTCD